MMPDRTRVRPPVDQPEGDKISAGERIGSQSSSKFQPMPDLTPEQYDALRDDIEAHGVLVPVTVDQHGRVLDGHNRMAIAAELGIDCPTTTKVVADDDEAADLAVTLNCARRHLTREQQREVIRAELTRRWGDSDRAVARRVGCSPTTVGTVRAAVRREAEESTVRVQQEMSKAASSLFSAAHDLTLLGADPRVIIERAKRARDAAAAVMADRLAYDGDVPTLAAIAAMCDFYAYTTLVNDLGDVLADLTAAGWQVGDIPPKLPVAKLDELTEELFSLSNLDTPDEAVIS